MITRGGEGKKYLTLILSAGKTGHESSNQDPGRGSHAKGPGDGQTRSLQKQTNAPILANFFLNYIFKMLVKRQKIHGLKAHPSTVWWSTLTWCVGEP